MAGESIVDMSGFIIVDVCEMDNFVLMAGIIE